MGCIGLSGGIVQSTEQPIFHLCLRYLELNSHFMYVCSFLLLFDVSKEEKIRFTKYCSIEHWLTLTDHSERNTEYFESRFVQIMKKFEHCVPHVHLEILFLVFFFLLWWHSFSKWPLGADKRGRNRSQLSYWEQQGKMETQKKKPLRLKLKALNLPSADAMSKSDPFLVIFQV